MTFVPVHTLEEVLKVALPRAAASVECGRCQRPPERFSSRSLLISSALAASSPPGQSPDPGTVAATSR